MKKRTKLVILLIIIASVTVSQVKGQIEIIGFGSEDLTINLDNPENTTTSSGGGVNETYNYNQTTAGDNRFLKLDTSNDPLTGTLSTNQHINLLSGKSVYWDGLTDNFILAGSGYFQMESGVNDLRFTSISNIFDIDSTNNIFKFWSPDHVDLNFSVVGGSPQEAYLRYNGTDDSFNFNQALLKSNDIRVCLENGTNCNLSVFDYNQTEGGDNRFLKLDASNDPLTGSLVINTSNNRLELRSPNGTGEFTALSFYEEGIQQGTLQYISSAWSALGQRAGSFEFESSPNTPFAIRPFGKDTIRFDVDKIINISGYVNINETNVNQWLYNQSDGSFNSSYDEFAYNQTEGGDTRFILRDSDNVTGIFNFTSPDATATATFRQGTEGGKGISIENSTGAEMFYTTRIAGFNAFVPQGTGGFGNAVASAYAFVTPFPSSQMQLVGAGGVEVYNTLELFGAAPLGAMDVNNGNIFDVLLLWNSSFQNINAVHHAHNGTGSDGVKVKFPTINHTFAFGTVYTNGGNRDKLVWGNIKTGGLDGNSDCAYATAYGDLNGLWQSIERFGTIVNGGVFVDEREEAYTFRFKIDDGGSWQINSTTCGSGSVSMEEIWEDVF